MTQQDLKEATQSGTLTLYGLSGERLHTIELNTEMLEVISDALDSYGTELENHVKDMQKQPCDEKTAAHINECQHDADLAFAFIKQVDDTYYDYAHPEYREDEEDEDEFDEEELDPYKRNGVSRYDFYNGR